MKLHPIIKNNTNKYDACGPAAVAAILGTGTEAAREHIRTAARDFLNRDKRRIAASTNLSEIMAALTMCGFDYRCAFISTFDKRISVAQILHKMKPTENEVFFLRVQRNASSGHFITTDGTKIIDNHRPEGCDLFDHPYINAIVTHIYSISSMNAGSL